MSKPVDGSIGILMLDTRFPRILGDLGNDATWPFEVQYKIVRGATAEAVVTAQGVPLVQPFIDCAKELESCGVSGITTSCGFLSLVQQSIAAELNVPFAASSLMQVPLIQRLLAPGKQVGILTIDSQALTAAHLKAAGAAIDTPVIGTEAGKEFTQAIMSDAQKMDIAQCRLDNVEASQRLLTEYSDIGAIVLECTNMVPYAKDIQLATALPVYSIYTFVNWFHAGLNPVSFRNDGSAA